MLIEEDQLCLSPSRLVLGFGILLVILLLALVASCMMWMRARSYSRRPKPIMSPRPPPRVQVNTKCRSTNLSEYCLFECRLYECCLYECRLYECSLYEYCLYECRLFKCRLSKCHLCEWSTQTDSSGKIGTGWFFCLTSCPNDNHPTGLCPSVFCKNVFVISNVISLKINCPNRTYQHVICQNGICQIITIWDPPPLLYASMKKGYEPFNYKR